MPAIKYRVDLTEEERSQLLEMIHKGVCGALKNSGTSAHFVEGGRGVP